MYKIITNQLDARGDAAPAHIVTGFHGNQPGNGGAVITS